MQIVSEQVFGPSAAVLIRTARRRARMTQRLAGEHCGIAPSVFSDYERGARDPSLGTLRKLLRPLGYDVSLTLVRRVGHDTQLRGPLGGIVRQHQATIVEVLKRHGATRVWVVGHVVEGLEQDGDAIILKADITVGQVMPATVSFLEELGMGVPIVVEAVYLDPDGDEEESDLPAPPYVELTGDPDDPGSGWALRPSNQEEA